MKQVSYIPTIEKNLHLIEIRILALQCQSLKFELNYIFPAKDYPNEIRN